MRKRVAKPVVEVENKDLSGLIAEFRTKVVSKFFDRDQVSDSKYLTDLLTAIQKYLDRVGVGHQCVHVTYNMSTQRIILAPSQDTDEVLTHNFEKQMGLWVKDDVRKGVESYIEASFEILPLHRRIDSLQSELNRMKKDQERPGESLWHNPFGYMPMPPFVRF